METSPNIHIGIIKKKRIDFHLAGKFNITGITPPLLGIFTATIEKGKLTLTGNNQLFAFENEVTLVPCNLSADYFEIKEVVIGIDFHWEQAEDQKFQGTLKLVILDDGIQVINLLPIENYLISVISSEMNASSSLQLLKAHAIISRSWLLAQIDKQKELMQSKTVYQLIHKTDEEYIRWYDREDHTLFHVCADDHCQRYQGITRVNNPKVVEAVQETMGQVLMYDKKICDARFSKSCGGVAERFENCWEPVPHPYLTAVIDHLQPTALHQMDLTIEENAQQFIHANPEALCNTRDEKILKQVLNNYDLVAKDFYRWQVTYTQDELSALILKKSGIGFGQILDLIPVERGASGRLIKLKIVGTKKTLVVGKELEIRRWLSKSHLYSSAFTVEKSDFTEKVPGKFTLHGAGWGHGVGLCQIGAAVMGEKGYSHTEILMHYFRNAEIRKEY
ncbi:MAG: SpoIID/LytB domain-containing protein [Salinivirgaceae bacterium]|nr:SpoIID/LytB domain-containing protein [Salinivirgaceae bacterium]